jgi:wyosine [tRNA(Phe)-imidazoG37] synthetase (radical SAM superfamily)
MKNSIPNSIYGPVESWRLGRSLGVDLLCVDSICSFECVYCQLGKINQVTTERDVFVSTEKVLHDLENSEWKAADVITFSGSGEPTLAKNLGEVIEKIKGITDKPIIILTNSTLLNLPEVRKEIALADKIFCKLDAWSDETLRRIDRPHKSISLESIISGIRLLRWNFKGFLAIQTMILRPPKESEIETFAEILSSIKPDEVQLNLPTRPVPQEYFVETRGNAVELQKDFTQLKTVSTDDLEIFRQRLSELTDLQIITR